jgi:hypothetical protein
VLAGEPRVVRSEGGGAVGEGDADDAAFLGRVVEHGVVSTTG